MAAYLFTGEERDDGDEVAGDAHQDEQGTAAGCQMQQRRWIPLEQSHLTEVVVVVVVVVVEVRRVHRQRAIVLDRPEPHIQLHPLSLYLG